MSSAVRGVFEKLPGKGLKLDGPRAARYAEAAFVQGSPNAAETLAYLHGMGIEGLKVDEKLAEFWSLQANESLAFAIGQGVEARPDVAKRLEKLDLWAWVE